MSQIGKLIKDTRLSKNLSQGKISKFLGYTSPQFVSNIERGLCVCPVPMARAIAKFLGISKAEIYNAFQEDFAKEFNEKWVKGAVQESLFTKRSK